jgi:hypothetical protein
MSNAAKLDAFKNWAKLLLLKAPDDIRASLATRNMQLQYAHEESYSNDLNFDLYPVRIDAFPTVGGTVLTPETFIKYVRENLNSLIDTSISEFHPYDVAVDGPILSSDNPLNAVLKIEIKKGFLLDLIRDNAAVVVSSATTTGWTFTTVTTPYTGHHPVSGHRTFFIARREGIYYFVNKGIDMTSTGIAGVGLPYFGEGGYDIADDLWLSLQERVVAFIKRNDGSATKERRISERIDWRLVYRQYRIPLERVFGPGAGSPRSSPGFDFS